MGLCWWHSEFQRAATYLTVYRPDLPKPSADEVEELIEAVITENRVVEIPGYRNLKEFSAEWKDEILSYLNSRQVEDGLNGAWIKAMAGNENVEAQYLQETIKQLYYSVWYEKKIVLQQWWMSGTKSHAWLVLNVEADRDGINIYAYESNTPWVVKLKYRHGDVSLQFEGLKKYKFVPYTVYDASFDSYERAIHSYCAEGGG